MKQSEQIWIENLARVSLGKALSPSVNQQIVRFTVNVFLEELCTKMIDYATHLNTITSEVKPSDSIQVLPLTQPRPGLIIIKSGDKMIISLVGKTIQVRTVQVHLDNQRNYQAFDFELKQNEQNGLFWRCVNDGQLVNPELVAQNYLSSFLVSGCRALPQTLRLVASHP